MNTSMQKPFTKATTQLNKEKLFADHARNFRKVTQRTADEVIDYVRGPKKMEWSFSNTQIDVDEDLTLTVLVYGSPVLRITRTSDNKDFDKVFIFGGENYDHYGNIIDTIKERLNGLLNTLGWCGVIPQGVRVFYDHDFGLTYFGRGDNKVALNSNYCTMASILADPSEFIFDEEMIVPRKPTDR